MLTNKELLNRLKQEKKHLDRKYNKLYHFIESAEFSSLNTFDRYVLKEQLAAMKAYRKALAWRIRRARSAYAVEAAIKHPELRIAEVASKDTEEEIDLAAMAFKESSNKAAAEDKSKENAEKLIRKIDIFKNSEDVELDLNGTRTFKESLDKPDKSKKNAEVPSIWSKRTLIKNAAYPFKTYLNGKLISDWEVHNLFELMDLLSAVSATYLLNKSYKKYVKVEIKDANGKEIFAFPQQEKKESGGVD